MGPHVVSLAHENGSKIEVIDYAEGPASVSDAEVSGHSTDDSKRETQNFSRIFDLIQEAEKRKKRKRNTKESYAFEKYRLAIQMYSGPRLGTTYDTDA